MILIITRFVVTLLFISSMTIYADNLTNAQTKLTDTQAKALRSLNDSRDMQLATDSDTQQPNQLKTIRLTVSKLSDSKGQHYLGAIVSRAELMPYLTALEKLLGDDFQSYRAFQAARDHQLFHMTLLNPMEYQLADKALVEQLVSSTVNGNLSSQLNVSLLGLGKVEQDGKKTFFVVAQSGEGQLIRQRFLLKQKDLHVTLAFNPNDIYGVKKDSSTLVK